MAKKLNPKKQKGGGPQSPRAWLLGLSGNAEQAVRYLQEATDFVESGNFDDAIRTIRAAAHRLSTLTPKTLTNVIISLKEAMGEMESVIERANK